MTVYALGGAIVGRARSDAVAGPARTYPARLPPRNRGRGEVRGGGKPWHGKHADEILLRSLVSGPDLCLRRATSRPHLAGDVHAPVALTDAFAEDAVKARQWRQFLTNTALEESGIPLHDPVLRAHQVEI